MSDAPPPEADALVRVGERFGRTVRWSADEIRHFAELAGDVNPMHHDAEYARASAVGGLIASGTQTSATMMGTFASWFSRGGDGVARESLGMSFEFRLRAPVYADETLRIDWEIVERHWKPRHRGWVVVARGTGTTSAGVALEATGTCLVRPGPRRHDRPPDEADRPDAGP